MELKQYDHIELKDGRVGTIVEVWEKGVAYEVDIDLEEGWETITVSHAEIKREIPQGEYNKIVTAV